MSLKTHALAFAGGLVGAALYARLRSGHRHAAFAGDAPAPRGPSAARDAALSAADTADSANAGERLKDRGLAESPLTGDGAPGAAMRDRNLFDSASANSDAPTMPGLPDFTRGA